MRFVILLILISFIACNSDSDTSSSQIEKWKEEVRQTELRFSHMADSLGVAIAFRDFAADSAVLLRGSSIIKGRNRIFERYSASPTGGKLSWEPDFIDVANSGDLAYTYGKYIFSSKDSMGNDLRNEGVFHTVWRRQEDGSWKYVWD